MTPSIPVKVEDLRKVIKVLKSCDDHGIILSGTDGKVTKREDLCTTPDVHEALTILSQYVKEK